MNIVLISPKTSIAFYIFNYPIKFYGLIMALSMLFAAIVGYNLIKKYFNNLKAQNFLDLIPFTILFSIIGARIFYVLGDFKFYLNNLDEIIKINHGGLSIFGGIIFGLIFLLIYSKHKKENAFYYLDIFSCVLPLAQSLGRWGNFFNQEAFGAPTNGFLKLYIDYFHRPIGYQNFEFFHPTFLYESVLDFILFIFLFWFYKKNNKNFGLTFCLYLIFYSLIRLFVENIRIDSVLSLNSFHIASLISVILFFVGLITLFILKRKKDR